MTIETDLKTCPFCGGEAFIDGLEDEPQFWIECKKCYSATRFGETKEGAISDWNTRAYDAEKQELIRIKCEYESIISKAKNEMRKLNTQFYNDVFTADSLSQMGVLLLVFGEELLK